MEYVSCLNSAWLIVYFQKMVFPFLFHALTIAPFFKIKVLLIYNLVTVSHEQLCDCNIHSY